MKSKFFGFLIVVFLIGIINTKAQTLKTTTDSISYIIGTNLGTSFKQNSLDINTNFLVKAIDDAIKGNKPLINDSVAKQVMAKFQQQMYTKQEAKRKEEAEVNKKTGSKFLDDNKKNKEIVVLPSGLQYKIVKKGTGSIPKETDEVKVNYEGTLIDGTIFDSSYERNEPATFPVNQVIKGWTEALQLMPVGSEWILYIPSDLAYGDRATGKIPAGSTLIFKVELLSIEKSDSKNQMQEEIQQPVKEEMKENKKATEKENKKETKKESKKNK